MLLMKRLQDRKRAVGRRPPARAVTKLPLVRVIESEDDRAESGGKVNAVFEVVRQRDRAVALPVQPFQVAAEGGATARIRSLLQRKVVVFQNGNDTDFVRA